MNITRVRAEHYRSYDAFDVRLPAGALAVIGTNGAGKSSLVEAIPLTIFGPEGRSLAPYLNEDEQDASLVLEVEFDHAGADYRIRRTYSPHGRGQTKVDFECRDDGSWEPLTAETAAATQDVIQSAIGLSRETFCASAYLGQGRGGQFTEAAPRDRKAILAEVLGLSSWDRLLEACRTDKRSSERESAELAGRTALLEERGGDLAALGEAKLRAEEVVSDRERALGGREAELTAAAEQVSTLERAESEHAARRAAVAAAEARVRERQAVVDRAVAATNEAVEVQHELDEMPKPNLEELISRQADAERLASARRDSERERDILTGEAAESDRQAERLAAEREDIATQGIVLSQKIRTLDEEQAEHTCDRCGQTVEGEAYERTLASLVAERDEAERRVEAYTTRIDDLRNTAHAKRHFAATIEIPEVMSAEDFTALTKSIEKGRELALERVRLATRLDALETQVAELTPEVVAEVEAANEALVAAQAALAEVSEPEPGALDAVRVAAVTAKASLDIAVSLLREARENLIRTESALEQAQRIAGELRAARERQTELQTELELLALLERAYGRDGIPALIVEASAIPQIEAEANRILSELGTSYRVELRTQRELKSGDGLADTLDVVVIGEAGARAYETFSGGERSRIDVALRLALASLLAHRRGAESKILVLDEVSFLDEAGQAALLNVVLGLRDRFAKQIIVSHHSALRDAPLDAVLAVSKIDGRSFVEVAA